MQHVRKSDREDCNWGVLLAWSSRFTADWLKIGFVISVLLHWLWTGCVAGFVLFSLCPAPYTPQMQNPNTRTTQHPLGPGEVEMVPGIRPGQNGVGWLVAATLSLYHLVQPFQMFNYKARSSIDPRTQVHRRSSDDFQECVCSPCGLQ